MYLLALFATLPSATPSEPGPPPEEVWLGGLWLVCVLCVAFALFILVDTLRERFKKYRRRKSRILKN